MNKFNTQRFTEMDDQRLDEAENAYAHDYAIDLAENMRANGVVSDQMSEDNVAPKNLIFAQVKLHFGSDFDDNRAALITESIWARAGELVGWQNLERRVTSSVEQAQTTPTDRDRFVRLIPHTSYITTGFWKKLSRAWKLSGGNAYNLKTGYQLNQPEKGGLYLTTVANKQADIAAGSQQKLVLAETIKEIDGLIKTAKNRLNLGEREIEDLKGDLKSVEMSVRNSAGWVDEFETALKIQQFEEDENGDQEGDIFSAFWGRKGDKKFAEAYRQQAEVEAEMIGLEKKVRKLLLKEANLEKVAENENAKGVFDPETISLREFENRQTHISGRLGGLAELINNHIYQVETTQKSVRDDLAAHKLHQADYQQQLKKLKNTEKKWLKVGPAELERLFWYHFGGKVTMIRDWQKQLPMVSRMGLVPFRSHTTAISREYTGLRELVRAFEETEGINGMMALMDRELGTIKINGSLSKPELEAAKKLLTDVQDQLKIRKARRLPALDEIELRGETSIPAPSSDDIKMPVSVETPVAAAPVITTDPVPPTNVTVSSQTIPDLDIVGVAPEQIAPTSSVSIEQEEKSKVEVTGNVLPATQPTLTTAVIPKVELAPNITVQPAPKIERLNIKDVKEIIENLRPVETLIVGDLNGSFEAYKKTLQALKVADEKMNWIGGERKVVLIGDILFDRVPEGLDILNKNRILREQAKADKGSLEVVFGNHEDMAVSFLTERETAGVSENTNNIDALVNAMQPRRSDKLEFDWQGKGILEFIAKWSQYGRTFKGDLETLKKDMEKQYSEANLNLLSGLATEIRLNMQNGENGRQILEEICQMKVVILDQDTIIFHTEPTVEILAELTKSADLKKTVEQINDDFQKSLRVLLFGEGVMQAGEFTRLCNVFAHPDNRDFPVKGNTPEGKANLAKLHDLGIDRIVHGHTTVHIEDAISKIDNLELINVDLGAGRPDEKNPEIMSVAILDKESKVALGKKAALDLLPFDFEKQAIVQKVDDWVDEVFPLDQDKSRNLAENLINIAKIESKEAVETKLSEELKEFLAAMAILVLNKAKGKVLKPDIQEVVEMINFYNEWIVTDKTSSLADKIKIIKSFDLTSSKALFDQWRNQKSKPAVLIPVINEKVTPDNIGTETAQAVTESSIAPDLEIEEAPATLKPLNMMDSAELKQRAFSLLPALLDMEDNVGRKALIFSFLEKVELEAQKTFDLVVKNICQYPEVVEFIFTGRINGQKLFPKNKPKPISSGEIKIHSNETNLIKFLLKTKNLEAARKYLESKNKTEITAELGKLKNLGQWFDQLSK